MKRKVQEVTLRVYYDSDEYAEPRDWHWPALTDTLPGEVQVIGGSDPAEVTDSHRADKARKGAKVDG